VAVDVTEAQPVADLSVLVDLRHTFIGDLVVTLLPPTGAPVVLHDRSGGAGRDLRRTYNAATTPALARFAGASAKGQWALKVDDRAARDVGELTRFGLELTLAAPPAGTDGRAAGGDTAAPEQPQQRPAAARPRPPAPAPAKRTRTRPRVPSS
jgi:subtilisin-like proprotein convertase family protein